MRAAEWGSEIREVVEADEALDSEGNTDRAKRRDTVPEACLGRFHRSLRVGARMEKVTEELGRSRLLRRKTELPNEPKR